MKRAFFYVSWVSLSVFLFSSCQKDPLKNMTDEQSRIYISNYDTTANFSSYKTFSITDSVAIIDNDHLVKKALTGFDSLTIASVKSAMQQKGYSLVDKGANPDLAIDISRVYNSYTGVISYTDYWDGYGGYWDPYYWGYPGYGYYAPYAVGVYNISEGGLEIDILDLKNATANGNKLKSVWSGLARGEAVFSTANAAAEVQALFDQSPYLKPNN